MKHIRRKKSRKRRLNLRKQLLSNQLFTKEEYKKLKKSKRPKKKGIVLKKEFAVDIFRRIRLKKGGYRVIQINPDEFVKSRNYEIYIRHRATKQRRLLAIGKLQDIPIFTKQPERLGRELAGRTFDASLKYPKRARGKWVPVNRIVRNIQKELEALGSDMRTEVRASIIPLKRYFHTEWKVYSDHIVKGNKKYKAVFVHCAVRFTYPNQDWIGKQSILFDSEKKFTLSKLHKMIPKIEQDLNNRLQLLHPQAENVSLMEVNGFIPLY